jgi:hypothetical protein
VKKVAKAVGKSYLDRGAMTLVNRHSLSTSFSVKFKEKAPDAKTVGGRDIKDFWPFP